MPITATWAVRRNRLVDQRRKHGDASARTSGTRPGGVDAGRGSESSQSLVGFDWLGKPPRGPPRWIRDRARGFDLRQQRVQWLQTAGDPARPRSSPIHSWERPRQRRRPAPPNLWPATAGKVLTPPGVVEHRDIRCGRGRSANTPTGLWPPGPGGNNSGVVSCRGAPWLQRPPGCDLHQADGKQPPGMAVLHLKRPCLNVCVMDPQAIRARCAVPLLACPTPASRPCSNKLTGWRLPMSPIGQPHRRALRGLPACRLARVAITG